MSRRIFVRTLVLAGALLAARAVVSGRNAADLPLPQPLAALPLRLGEWAGIDAPAYSPEIVRTLGADEYVNRVYRGPSGRAVGLYVAYYAAQRHGDAIHSPLHCLPGTGWSPVSRREVAIDSSPSGVTVNRYLVERHDRRQLVLYWFQGRGRTAAGEYEHKLQLLADGLLRGRTNGALVRVMAPVDDGEHAADAAARAFVRIVHPHLARWLP